MNPLFEVCNLEYDYGSRTAVDSLSFKIQVGEVFGLLGANGAGKTTTLSCIAGLLKPPTGSFRMEGESFHPSTNRMDRGLLGFVPQDLALYDGLSGRENLSLFAELTGVAVKDRQERVREMLEFAGLTSRQDDLVRVYSGGMKRRLNLVAGLIHRPKLVLLDEPTVGVDPQSRNHLFESIKALREQGMSILYTTHYMEEAEKLCDRIAIMDEGKLIAQGSLDDLARQIDRPGDSLEQIFLKLTGRQLRDDS